MFLVVFLNSSRNILQIYKHGTSLVVHWLKICLPVQGTWVRSLAQEDSTCHRACVPQLQSPSSRALELQLPSLCAETTEADVLRARALQQEKPLQ